MSELEMGIAVEKEHADTIRKIKKDLYLTEPEIFQMIAEDHIKEIPDYYTRLKKMEEEGKAAEKTVQSAWLK